MKTKHLLSSTRVGVLGLLQMMALAGCGGERPDPSSDQQLSGVRRHFEQERERQRFRKESPPGAKVMLTCEWVDSITGVHPSPDRTRIAVTGGDPSQSVKDPRDPLSLPSSAPICILFDVETRKELGGLDGVLRVAWSPDNRHIAAVGVNDPRLERLPEGCKFPADKKASRRWAHSESRVGEGGQEDAWT